MGDEPADLTDSLVDWESNSTESVVQVTADIEEKERVATNISNKTSEFPNRIVHPRQHLCLSFLD